MLSNQLGLARSTAASRSERRKKESDGGILHGKATPRQVLISGSSDKGIYHVITLRKAALYSSRCTLSQLGKMQKNER